MNVHSPDFALSEAGGVQLQALTTLANLGWRYVSRTEAERQRGHRRGGVILEDIAREALARINAFEQDGARHPFTESGIEEGLRRLRDQRFDGLLKTNEIATDMLLLGVAVPQTVGGLSRERPFRFAAWGGGVGEEQLSHDSGVRSPGSGGRGPTGHRALRQWHSLRQP